MTDAAFKITNVPPFGALIEAQGSGAVMPPPSPEFRKLLLTERLLIFRGFEPFADKAATAAYASGWGPLLEWDFGPVFEVLEQEAPKNYLFTSGSVPFHWDGAFAKQVPWLQVFQCVESPGVDQGGETLFCDTAKLWRTAPTELQALWRNVEFEYATEKLAHYGGRIRAKLVATHPLTGETVLRFNEPANAATVNLNTPEVIPHGVPPESARDFLADVTRRIYAPDVCHAHAWQPGDRVIADNFVLLHGRSPYRAKLPRKLWRAHVLSKQE